MKVISFIRNWTLPISMLTGAASYFIYANIHALDHTHAFANKAISIVQPAMLFAMLFISFCKVDMRHLKPARWMIKPLLIQTGSFLAMSLLAICSPTLPGLVILESAMLCMICPTATAAAVVTTKLHGDASTVVSYTCIINLAASILIPAVVPMLPDNPHPDLTFIQAFLLIIAKVFPLLILPLVAAWFTRHFLPKFHKAILSKPDLAFHIWAVSLALAIAVSVKAIMRSSVSGWELFGIAIASLLACIIQFVSGRIIGRHHNEPIAGAQMLGQKNTVFIIWAGYTFLNPVTAIAGGFYSVWHNVANSYQLWRERKHNSL